MVQEKYRQFVQAGKKQAGLWDQLKNQIYLGSDQFIEDRQSKIDPEQSLRDVPKTQKNSPVKALSFYKEKFKSRNRAMAEAYRSGHYTLAEVGNEFGVSYATVSRAVKALECQM